MYLLRNTIQLLSILLLVMCQVAKGEDGSQVYKERVELNFSRSTYIAGERIWIKAYCLSNTEFPLKSLSKTLYVELVDFKRQHVMGQILKMEEGLSASCIQIPDTLSSGVYFIKGYTNWMKNFDDRKFFSAPLFIYNNYDEKNHSETLSYTIHSEPEIYVQGGNLIHNIPARVSVYEPGLFGRETKAFLIQSPKNDSSSYQLLFNAFGLASFDIVPEKGVKYSIVYGDSQKETINIELPEVKYSGYFIELINANDQELTLRFRSEAIAHEQIVLNLIQDSKILYTISLSATQLNTDIKIPLAGVKYSKFELRLENISGEYIANAFMLKHAKETIVFDSFVEEAKCNIRNAFQISLKNDVDIGSGNFSVDIYKKEPSINSGLKNLFYTDFDNKYIIESHIGEIYTLCPVLYGNSKISHFGNIDNLNGSIFPIEDLGILFTGKILSKSDAIILDGSEAILSIIDTLPDMQASKIASDGSFVFLIDKYKSMEAYIDLKNGAEQLTNDFKVQADEKFYYASKNMNSDNFEQFSDDEFSNSIKEESDRVLIQRAFGHLNPEGTDSLFNKPYSLQGFYGDPLLVIYPEDFFLLPNFGEIIREIVPRVKFKESHSQCELIVSDIENGTKSNNPLVVLDGIQVNNICELQLLNSDHIQRIEIQSGLRVAGNYLYHGLVAIYTTKDYKLKYSKSNLMNTYSVPGFAYSPDFSDLFREYISTGEDHPDFRNQLYWNPNVTLKIDEKSEIEFLTSDELGEYMIEITGFTEKGVQISRQETFSIVQ